MYLPSVFERPPLLLHLGHLALGQALQLTVLKRFSFIKLNYSGKVSVVVSHTYQVFYAKVQKAFVCNTVLGFSSRSSGASEKAKKKYCFMNKFF